MLEVAWKTSKHGLGIQRWSSKWRGKLVHVVIAPENQGVLPPKNLKAKIGDTKVVLQREGFKQLIAIVPENQEAVPQLNHEKLERVRSFLSNLENPHVCVH